MKIQTKNLAFINMYREKTYLTYKVVIDGKDFERSEEIETPIEVTEHRTSLKGYEWSHIHFDSSIVKLFSKITRIEIWYENGHVFDKDIIRDTVLVFTKDGSMFSFDQYRKGDRRQSNGYCALVKKI